MAKFKCISTQYPRINFLGYVVKSGKVVEVEDSGIADKFRNHQDFEEILPEKKKQSKKSNKEAEIKLAPLLEEEISEPSKE